MLFMEETKEIGDDNEVKIIKKLNPKLVPGSVAIINCDTQDIMSRIEEMSPETCKKLE